MKNILISLALSVMIQVQAQTFSAGTQFQNYSDIMPDSLIKYTVTPATNRTYSFNVVGDAGYDLLFTARGGVSPGGSAAFISVVSLNPSLMLRFGRWDSVFVPANTNWNVTKVAKPLTMGETINAPGAVWDSSTLYLSDHSGSGGGNKNVNDWIGGDKYIGMQFQNGVNMNYGWMRLSCPSADSCFVKDLSFSTTPATLRTRSAESELKIYPNPGTTFYIDDLKKESVRNVSITDLIGNPVSFSLTETGRGIKITVNENYPDGCYFLSLQKGQLTFYRRLIKAGK